MSIKNRNNKMSYITYYDHTHAQKHMTLHLKSQKMFHVS